VRFLSHVLQIYAKDMRTEWRSREIVYTTGLFAALLVLVFSFAFSADGRPLPGAAGGVLWVVIAFSGTLGLTRFFEREGETLGALLLSPVSPAAIYLAKLLAVTSFMLLTEALLLPLLALLFQLRVESIPLLVALVLLGSVGYAAVGCLFAAGLMRARSREVLLGILTYPIVLPVIIAGAKGTAALVAGGGQLAAAPLWLKLVALFDLVFVTLSVFVFGPLVNTD